MKISDISFFGRRWPGKAQRVCESREPTKSVIAFLLKSDTIGYVGLRNNQSNLTQCKITKDSLNQAVSRSAKEIRVMLRVFVGQVRPTIISNGM